MSKVGKKEYDNLYKKMAEEKIEKSGYPFLNGFYYYLLSNMAHTSSWDYTYKIIRFLDDMEIDDPKNIKLDHYVKHLVNLKDTSSSNQITSYSALKKFSKYLYANKCSDDDYMRFVDRPKNIVTDEQIAKREAGIITKKDYKAAIKNVSNTKKEWKRVRDTAIIEIFMGTGIRRAALYKLDLSDFDFENNTINVSEKGDKYRKIYCSERIMDDVKEWFKYREKMVPKTEVAAFISSHNCRITNDGILKVIKQYSGDKSPHKYRAGYITEVYSKTGDIYLAQQAVGHSSPQTTQLYIRGKKEESAKKAAEIMAKMMG